MDSSPSSSSSVSPLRISGIRAPGPSADAVKGAGAIALYVPALTPAERVPLNRVRAAPPARHLVAAKDLVTSLRTGSFEACSDEVKRYFVGESAGLFSVLRQLDAAGVLLPEEIATAAGKGVLLTAALRKVILNAPEVVTAFDGAPSEKVRAFSRNWAEFSRRGLGEAEWTSLARDRSRAANARACGFSKAHPHGDGGKARAEYEERLWADAERRVIG